MVAQLGEEVSVKKQELKNATTEKELAEEATQKANEERITAQQEKEVLLAGNKDLRMENSRLESHKNRLRMENHDLKQKQLQLQTDNEELEQRHEDLQYTNSKLENVNDQLSADNHTLEQRNDSLKSDNQALRQKYNDLQQNNVQFEKQQNELKSHIEQMVQDYIIRRLQCRDVVVQGNPRVFKALRNQMVITEVLTESHLYELSLDEGMVNEIIKRRDSTLRQLALSDKMGIPTAAMFLKDSLDNPSGLEEAVARVLTVFGFELTPIGGNGEPDGKAEACLGFNEEGKNKSYSLTYDAKSTAKKRIAAATAHLSGLRRHRETYKADFSLEVAIDYQGSDDEMSAISVEAKNEKVTMMTAKDLIKLLLLITPKQIGLDKLRELFETCYAPQDVHQWIENVEKLEVEKPPYYELIDIIYDLQKSDSEAPVINIVRYQLKAKMEDLLVPECEYSIVTEKYVEKSLGEKILYEYWKRLCIKKCA